MSKTIVLILKLSAAFLGILVIWFSYLRAVTPNPNIVLFAELGLFFGIIIGTINILILLINHIKPQPPPPATKEDIVQIIAIYMKLPIDEVKREIEEKLKAQGESSNIGRKAKSAQQRLKLGNIANEGKQFKDAITHYKAVLKIVKAPSIFLSIGVCFFEIEDYSASIKNFRAALDLYKNSQNREGEGRAIDCLGVAYRTLDQYDKAIEYHKQALSIAREIGVRSSEGNALCYLGLTYQDLGQYDKAIEHHKQALSIAREIGDRRGEGRGFYNLGNTYSSFDQDEQDDKAIEYYEKALSILPEYDLSINTLISIVVLNKTTRSVNPLQKGHSIDYYELALTQYREGGDREREAFVLIFLGDAYFSSDQDEKGLKCIDEAMQIIPELQLPDTSPIIEQLTMLKSELDALKK